MAAKRIDGVTEAEFHYPAGTGTVTYDTTRTTLAAVVVELSRATGFEAAVREAVREP